MRGKPPHQSEEILQSATVSVRLIAQRHDHGGTGIQRALKPGRIWVGSMGMVGSGIKIAAGASAFGGGGHDANAFVAGPDLFYQPLRIGFK
jgi:hypothetical protein